MEEEIEKVSGIGTVTEAAEKAVEAFDEKTLEELTEENKRLQEENERLKNRSIKERMYDKINVSVRTIDIFIGFMCVLFVAVVVMGSADRDHARRSLNVQRQEKILMPETETIEVDNKKALENDMRKVLQGFSLSCLLIP